MSAVRLYVDEDASEQAVVRGLRARGIDVATTADAWRLHVLDLATMTTRLLRSETRYVDDQAEWFDDGHVLYAIQRQSSAVSDVWMAAVDDGEAPRLYLSEASSPAVVR